MSAKRKTKHPARFKKGHQINSKGGLDIRLRVNVSDELLERLQLAYEVDEAFRLIPVKHRSFSDWLRLAAAEKADQVLGPKSKAIPAGDPRSLLTIPLAKPKAISAA